jgi:hypothetical protein
VDGRRLTRTETQAVADAVNTALQLVAARSYAAKVPPPPPTPRERRPAQFFNPLQTQELRRVTAEDIEAARKAGPK